MMTLAEAIRDLEALDDDSTIYAAAPWTAESRCVVAREPDDGRVPREAQRHGLTYFLEVSIARDFADGWASSLGQEPTPAQKCNRLIQYARDDA